MLLILSFEQVLLLSTASPPRYRGRCWAAIPLSHRPETSGRVVRGEVNGLDSGGRHARRFVLCHTRRSQRRPYPHMYRQERKRPTPVRRRLSWTQAFLGRVIPGGCVLMSGIKMRSLVGFSAHSAFHWWSAHCATRMLLLLTEKLMSCAAGTNGCLDLRRRAAAPNGRVSAEWSRCPGSMARRPRDSVAPQQRSRLDVCEDWKVVRWCWTQASSHSSQGVVDDGVNKVGMSTAAPNRSTVLCSRMDQG